MYQIWTIYRDTLIQCRTVDFFKTHFNLDLILDSSSIFLFFIRLVSILIRSVFVFTINIQEEKKTSYMDNDNELYRFFKLFLYFVVNVTD